FSIASFRDPVTLCLVPLSLTRRSSDLAGAPVAQDGELVLDQGVSQHGEIGEVGVRHAREATSHYATTPRSGTTDRPGALRCGRPDRKSTRLNSSHEWISYAVFCLKKKT